MRKVFFHTVARTLILLTGKGYGRSRAMNDLHHKLSFRLHKLLPLSGITGLVRLPLRDIEGATITLRANDGGVAHRFLVYGEYEPFETSVVKQQIHPGMTVYNIGANAGYYTILSSRLVGPNGSVIAFEPEPGNFELLQTNIRENLLTNVTAMNVAVGSESGSVSLALSTTNSGDHQIGASENALGREAVTVPIVSLDNLISNGMNPPDVIIMDVQGHEYEVMRGFARYLAMPSPKPLIMITELWQDGLERREQGSTQKLLIELRKVGHLHVIDEAKDRVESASVASVLERVAIEREINLLVKQ